jgi:hypothetical protein
MRVARRSGIGNAELIAKRKTHKFGSCDGGIVPASLQLS